MYIKVKLVRGLMTATTLQMAKATGTEKVSQVVLRIYSLDKFLSTNL